MSILYKNVSQEIAQEILQLMRSKTAWYDKRKFDQFSSAMSLEIRSIEVGFT